MSGDQAGLHLLVNLESNRRPLIALPVAATADG
jgi:hypothetical protein